MSSRSYLIVKLAKKRVEEQSEEQSVSEKNTIAPEEKKCERWSVIRRSDGTDVCSASSTTTASGSTSEVCDTYSLPLEKCKSPDTQTEEHDLRSKVSENENTIENTTSESDFISEEFHDSDADPNFMPPENTGRERDFHVDAFLLRPRIQMVL